jgi:hypothetical protein
VRFNEIRLSMCHWVQLNIVMRGLVPRIHVFAAAAADVDGRHKAGHDDDAVCASERFLVSAGP